MKTYQQLSVKTFNLVKAIFIIFIFYFVFVYKKICLQKNWTKLFL